MLRRNTCTRKSVLRLWLRIVLAVVLCFGMIFSFVEMYFMVMNMTKSKTVLYNYNLNKDINYTVSLFDNDFTDTKIMPSGKVYISELVDKINLSFNFDFSGSKKTNVNYAYLVYGTLIGTTSNNGTDQNVWEKNYNLIDGVEKTVENTKSYSITFPLTINYQDFVKDVNSFKTNFSLPITAKLRLIVLLNIASNYKESNINNTEKLVVYIPVGIQSFAITTDYSKVTSNKIYEKPNKLLLNSDITSLSIASLTFLTCLVFFIDLYKIIFNIKCQNKYSLTLEKIMKKYKDNIVEVITPIDEKKYQVVDVRSFEELVNLSEKINASIIFNEVLPTRYGIFTIIDDNILYKYSLKNKSL